MPKLPLHWKILIGLALGVLTGLAVNLFWTDATWTSLGVNNPVAYLAGKADAGNESAGAVAAVCRFGANLNRFIGNLFIRGLRFIAVPIVLFSMLVAVADLGDPRKLGRVGGKTIALFLFTGITSSILGVTLASTIRPGTHVPEASRADLPGQAVAAAEKAEAGAQQLSAWDMALNTITDNPFNSIANAQMLQIVVVAIAIGLGLTLIPQEKARPVIAFCEGLADAVLKLVQLLMHFAPYAVFALMSSILAGLGLHVFKALALFCVVVLLGLAIILFILYPGLTTLLTPRTNKVGYRRYFKSLAPAQLVAFSSSSSAATLPVTMQCCRERLGASDDITSFVCSLGVSFNMDGTALYQAIVVTFLAQLYGVPLEFPDLVAIALMTAALSIGVPGIPSGGLVIMAVVLDSIGVPPQGIAVILAVDRILDMSRTVINVSGDAMGTAIIAASEGKLKTEAEMAPT